MSPNTTPCRSHLPIEKPPTHELTHPSNPQAPSSSIFNALASIPSSHLNLAIQRLTLIHESLERLQRILYIRLFKSTSFPNPPPRAHLAIILFVHTLLSDLALTLNITHPLELLNDWAGIHGDEAPNFIWDVATFSTWRLLSCTALTRGLYRKMTFEPSPSEKLEALERVLERWGGAEVLWRVFQRFADEERVEREFWFLRAEGRDGVMAWIGDRDRMEVGFARNWRIRREWVERVQEWVERERRACAVLGGNGGRGGRGVTRECPF